MTLPARAAYPLWADRYEEETAVSRLEDRIVRGITRGVGGATLLDIACGTGRRFAEHVASARLAVGVDLVPEMLRAGCVDPRRRGRLIAGDLRALPVRGDLADVTWCRLAIGHVRELGAAYRELARVTRVGGTVVVSDFHPDAVVAGHRRTFHAADGTLREVEHFPRAVAEHIQTARAAGLAPVVRETGLVGPDILEFFERAGRMDAYRAQLGLALVWVTVLAR